MFGKISTGILFASAALLTVTTSARADFRVCNKSSHDQVDVAYGHQTRNEEWLSEGWWTVTRGQCATLVTGPLRSRYFYVYGKSSDTVWQGDESQESGVFCTRNEKFTLPGDMDCERAGYDTHKFIEVDTGDYDSFTYNLTD